MVLGVTPDADNKSYLIIDSNDYLHSLLQRCTENSLRVFLSQSLWHSI